MAPFMLRDMRSLLPATLLASLALAAPAAASAATPKIAFESYAGISTARPDGTGVRLVVKGADAPSWSPGHRRLAYVRKNAVWTARADGSDRRRVVSLAHGVPFDPAWSPDGSRIAYVQVTEVPRPGADDGEVDEVHTVFTVRPDGSGRRMVHAGDSPAWTATGHHIVLARPRGAARSTLGIVKPDGRGYRRLLRADGWISDVAVSPDGRRVAYVQALGNTGLGVYDRPSHRHRFMPAGERTALLDVAWTPHGSRLAWLQHPIRARAGRPPATRLYTARPDGSQRRTQATFAGPDFLPDGLAW